MMELNDTIDNITGNSTNFTGSENGTSSGILTESTFCCEKTWGNAWDIFNRLHPNPVAMLLCIVGCVTNVFNLIVFTQKSMRSPTITILTMLAVSDFFYVFRRMLSEIILSQSKMTTRTVVTFRFFDSLFHFWSVVLTVGVAVWRYVMIRFPLRSRSWCTEQTARWTILISFISSGIFAFFSRVLGEDVTKTKKTRERYGALVHFWANSLIEKLFPCFILLFVSLQLRQSLIKNKKKRFNMTVKSREKAKTEKENCSRTTQMLLFAVMLFLVTELPSGIFSFITAILFSIDPNSSFYQDCFRPIRHLMGMLEFVSSAANFFIYYSTGANFKQTFLKMVECHLSKVIKMKRSLGGNLKFVSGVSVMDHSTTGTGNGNGTGTGIHVGNQTDSKILPSLLSIKNKSIEIEIESKPDKDQVNSCKIPM